MTKYTLPIATASTLGGIKVGKDFTTTPDGTLNIKDMDQMKQSLAELPNQVEKGKAQIAAAITEKGIETAADATFNKMAENIGKISGGVSYEAIFNHNVLLPYTLIEEG